jgi:hypothetical protein
MGNLTNRLKALEVKAVDNTPPLPALVRFANTDADRDAAQEELKTRVPGTPLVLIETVDSRKQKVYS